MNGWLRWGPVVVGVLAAAVVLLLSRARLAGQETPLATLRHTVYGGPMSAWGVAATPKAGGRPRPWWLPGWLERLVAPVAARAAGSSLGRGWAASWAADLRVADVTLPRLLGEGFAFGVAVFVAVELVWVATWLTTQLAGVAALPALPVALVGVVGAAVAVFGRVRMLPGVAARRRVEFRQMACDFISLVACYLTTAATAEVAVDRAARDGGGWAWTELARAVHGARAAGRSTEEAFVSLADLYGVRQLRDMGAALARYQSQGSITEAVMALAASMRAEMLDGLEREADRANQRMLGPVYLYVGGVLVLVLLPLLDMLASSL